MCNEEPLDHKTSKLDHTMRIWLCQQQPCEVVGLNLGFPYQRRRIDAIVHFFIPFPETSQCPCQRRKSQRPRLGQCLWGRLLTMSWCARQPCTRPQNDDLPALSLSPLDRNSDYAARNIPPQVQTVSAMVLDSFCSSISENSEQRLRCCKASSHYLRPTKCHDGKLELVQCL